MRVTWRRYIARRGIDFDQWVVDLKLTSYEKLCSYFEARNVEPPDRTDVLHLVGPADPVKPVLARPQPAPSPVRAVEKPTVSIRDNKARLLELASKMKVRADGSMTKAQILSELEVSGKVTIKPIAPSSSRKASKKK